MVVSFAVSPIPTEHVTRKHDMYSRYYTDANPVSISSVFLAHFGPTSLAPSDPKSGI
jgi:hypothetical protein